MQARDGGTGLAGGAPRSSNAQNSNFPVLRTFVQLVSSQRGKAELKAFEQQLVSLDSDDMSTLVHAPDLWRVLRESLAQYEAQWDVLGMLLNRLSLESEGRQEALDQGFTSLIGDTLAVKGRTAKGDRAINIIGSMACILSLLAIDATESQVTPWCNKLCLSVLDALERSQAKGASSKAVMEAYTMLSAFIKLLYTSTGSQLAGIIAKTFVNAAPGGVPLLFRVAKKGLVEEELTGAPKIVAEKSLVVLAKLNADAPETRFVPNQLDPNALCSFLVKCARECSWVQSQDIAVTFLARLIFKQAQVPADFLDKPEVVEMLRRVMSHKSTALKVTGVAFISMCPPAVFYQLAAEFEQSINVLADSPTRTLKAVILEASRGIWGMDDCPLSVPAEHSLRHSHFLHHAAEHVPSLLPKCLWKLLPAATQRMVAASQGITLTDADLPPDGDGGAAGGAAPAHGAASRGEADADAGGAGADYMDEEAYSPDERRGGALPWPREAGTSAGGFRPSPSPPASHSLQGNGAAAGHGEHGLAPGNHTFGGRGYHAAEALDSHDAEGHGQADDQQQQFGGAEDDGAAVTAAAATSHRGGPPQQGVGDGAGAAAGAADGRHGEDSTARRALHKESTLASAPGPSTSAQPRAKSVIRVKKSVVDTVQAVLALQQLQGGNGGAAEEGPSGMHADGVGPSGAGGPKRRLSHDDFDRGHRGDGHIHDDEDTSLVSMGGSKRPRRTSSHLQSKVAAPPQSLHLPHMHNHNPPLPSPGSAIVAHPASAANDAVLAPDDVYELNQLLDIMYEQRHTAGPRGLALIKNMAEGAANISMVGYLRTYSLPSAMTAGLDDRLSTLRARAHLVYSGFMSNEPLDLLLPFSELLCAESGIIRRNMEAAAKAAGVPATSTEGSTFFNGGSIGDAARY